jgi:F-type H+-transporting ATPase subunit a
MGEHATWTDFLKNIPQYQQFLADTEVSLGRDWQWLMFGADHFSLTHVLWAFFVMLFVIFGASRFASSVKKKGGIVPPPNFNLRNIFETIADATYGMMVQVMGEKDAKRHLPLIGSLAFFIFFSNICALIPGFGVPTTSLNTNVGMALLVFSATHYYGLKEHGLSYLKHFSGPKWWLAPLMFPIELISHIVRPISLAVRLLGNMVADHKVVFSFFTLVPILVPVPFLILGVLVSVVQTLVFCLLSMVYISMATAHDH